MWDVLLLHHSLCLFSKADVLFVQSEFLAVDANCELLFLRKLRGKCLLLFVSCLCKELLNFLIILLELFATDALIQRCNSACHLNRLFERACGHQICL